MGIAYSGTLLKRSPLQSRGVGAGAVGCGNNGDLELPVIVLGAGAIGGARGKKGSLSLGGNRDNGRRKGGSSQ
jgi:hypothetical protein